MAETQLENLLEYFYKTFPNPFTGEELEKKFSVELVNRAISSRLIYPLNDKYNLTDTGLGMIIQLRTKQAIDKLNIAIKEFDESSKRFSKYMFWLTLIYTISTLLIVLKEFFPNFFTNIMLKTLFFNKFFNF